MNKPDSWLPLYVGDYLGDTTRFSLEHHGAYMLLIMDYWKNGPIPDDDETIATTLGVTVQVWRKLAPLIRPKFRIDNGVLTHKRIEFELKNAQERTDKAAEKAKRAAEARWGREGPPGPSGNAPSKAPRNARGNAPSNAQASTSSNAPRGPQAMHEDMHEECPSPSHITTTAPTKAPLSTVPPYEIQGQNTLSDSAPPSSDVIPFPRSGKPENRKQQALDILAFLNEKTGRHFRGDSHVRAINARLTEGYTPAEIRAVIARKCRKWKGDPRMDEFLRPKTLFGRENFANYVGEVPPPETPQGSLDVA